MNHTFLFIAFALMGLNFAGVGATPAKAEGIKITKLPQGASDADIAASNASNHPTDLVTSPAAEFAKTIFGSPSSDSSVNSTQDPVNQPPQEGSSILPDWAVKILKDNGIDIDDE